jgi:hypothetical protein
MSKKYPKPKMPFQKGIIWLIKGAERIGILSLDEALDTLAVKRCCGVNCCNNSLTLRDQVTDVPTQITIVNGVVTISTVEEDEE